MRNKWGKFLCWLGLHDNEYSNEYDELENIMYSEAICKRCRKQTYFHEHYDFLYRG
jgi:hypothetical protein